MRIKTIVNGFIFVLFVLALSCSRTQNSLERVFSHDELRQINLIIDFYDTYVLTNTNTALPVEAAYSEFVENNRPSENSQGDPDIFFIHPKERNELFKSINEKLLVELYTKQDSVTIRNPQTKERFVVYPQFHFTLNCDGKFMGLINDLAASKPYYAEIHEQILNMGGVSPSLIAKLLFEDNEIDFSRRDERFVFIVIFLE